MAEYMMNPKLESNPTNWAKGEVEGVIKGEANAELNRGIDLSAGGEVGVDLEAHMAKFLALDVRAEAHAKVELKLQAQILLDLFEEVGVAIRLRAAAEAAASINVAIGINTEDFLNLAKKSPLIGDSESVQGDSKSVQMKLLETILNEIIFQGGVVAKAAFCAMAYANVSCTGRLIKKGAKGPGFYMVGDFGLGFSGGVGYQMFVKAGIKDPRRLIRNSVDIAVDCTLKEIAQHINLNTEKAKEDIALLWSLRAPAKMAIRMAYETGISLSKDPDPPIGTDDVATELKNRCVQVAIEEAQPYILELLQSWAIKQFREKLGLGDTEWNLLEKETDSVAYLLSEIPENPFSTSEDKLEKNLEYWKNVIIKFDNLRTAISEEESEIELYLSIVWAATQLLFVVSHYSHNIEARKKANSTKETIDFLKEKINVTPPESIRKAIFDKLGQKIQDEINQEQLLKFVSTQMDDFVGKESPVRDILKILSGGVDKNVDDQENLKKILDKVLTSIGSLDLKQMENIISLPKIQKGLNWYINDKVTVQLKHVIEKSNCNQLLKDMLNEVLVDSLTYTTEQIIQAVIKYPEENDKRIREACSAVLMRLISRSLVVMTDELLNCAMEKIHGELVVMVGKFSNGAYNDKLTKLPLVSNDNIKNVDKALEEAFSIAAIGFQPIPVPIRAKIRNSLYSLLGGMPKLDELKSGKTPHEGKLKELVEHTSGILKDYIVQFAKAFLLKIANIIKEKISELADVARNKVTEFEKHLEEKILAVLNDKIDEVKRNISDIEAKIKESLKKQKEHVTQMISFVINSKNKEAIKGPLIAKIKDHCTKTYKPIVSVPFNLFIGKVGPGLLDVAFKACNGLDIVKFLEEARNAKASDEIAEQLGHSLGIIIQSQFKFQHEFGVKRFKKTYTLELPKNVVIGIMTTAIKGMKNILNLSNELFIKINEVKSSETEKTSKTSIQTDTNNKIEKVNDLLHLPEDAKVSIIAPLVEEDLTLTDPDGKVQVQFENFPREFLGIEPSSLSHVLIWVNNELLDLKDCELIEQNGLVIVPIQLDPGPNCVHAMIVDNNAEDSKSFFVNVLKEGDISSLNSWMTFDEIKIDDAKNKLKEQLTKAKDSVSELVPKE